MKQKDIALILIIVIISGCSSFYISQKLFASEEDRSVEVKTVEAINTEFVSPDKKYFNDQSINPTQTITIGGSQQPATEQR